MTVKTKFIIKGFEDYGSIGVCEISDEAISQALRTSTSRRKLSIENLDTTLQNAQPRVCAFCSRKFKRFTYNHQVLSVDKFQKRRNAYEVYLIEITGVVWKDDNLYCKSTECSGKHLNPNSVDFVSVTRGISRDEALALIHERNNSPFYSKNHDSIEAYINYQNVHARANDKQRSIEIIEKQNFSRSLQGYIQRFGLDDGTRRWNLIQSQKGITVENLSRIYDTDTALAVYEKWKSDTRNTLENFIRRYGEFEGHEKWLAYKELNSQNFRPNNGLYGKRCEVDGIRFYSMMERDFYLKLKSKNFHWPVKHDVVYPGTLMRSDFYFPMIDVHVEIAGSWHISGYSERMQLKQDLFSCWIVKNTKEYDTIISKLEKAHAERSRLTDFATGID